VCLQLESSLQGENALPFDFFCARWRRFCSPPFPSLFFSRHRAPVIISHVLAPFFNRSMLSADTDEVSRRPFRASDPSPRFPVTGSGRLSSVPVFRPFRPRGKLQLSFVLPWGCTLHSPSSRSDRHRWIGTLFSYPRFPRPSCFTRREVGVLVPCPPFFFLFFPAWDSFSPRGFADRSHDLRLTALPLPRFPRPLSSCAPVSPPLPQRTLPSAQAHSFHSFPSFSQAWSSRHMNALVPPMEGRYSPFSTFAPSFSPDCAPFYPSPDPPSFRTFFFLSILPLPTVTPP